MLPYELTEGKLIIHILHIYYNTHSGGVSLQNATFFPKMSNVT